MASIRGPSIRSEVKVPDRVLIRLRAIFDKPDRRLFCPTFPGSAARVLFPHSLRRNRLIEGNTKIAEQIENKSSGSRPYRKVETPFPEDYSLLCLKGVPTNAVSGRRSSSSFSRATSQSASEAVLFSLDDLRHTCQRGDPEVRDRRFPSTAVPTNTISVSTTGVLWPSKRAVAEGTRMILRRT